MANNSVKYKGVVQKVGDGCLYVKILKTSSCAACSIKGHCSAAESTEKIVEVDNAGAAMYRPGEEVWLVGTMSMGRSALWYGIVIPFLVVVCTIFILTMLKTSEAVAALGSLAMLAPYYFLLSLNKEKMKRKFGFYVLPME